MTTARYELARLLSPWGIAMPESANALDAVLDRVLALRRQRPDDTRLSAVLAACGRAMREDVALALSALH